jgi:hypothetical protein
MQLPLVDGVSRRENDMIFTGLHGDIVEEQGATAAAL